MNRFLVLGIVMLILFLIKKPESVSKSIDPHLEIRPRIFREDKSSAESASSSDDGDRASADDDGTPGHLTPEPFAARELELQMELVNLLAQVDELKKENEQLKQPKPVVYAAPANCPTGTCAPARTTYGNYYQGSGYYYNNTRPARGLFRRW